MKQRTYLLCSTLLCIVNVISYIGYAIKYPHKLWFFMLIILVWTILIEDNIINLWITKEE